MGELELNPPIELDFSIQAPPPPQHPPPQQQKLGLNEKSNQPYFILEIVYGVQCIQLKVTLSTHLLL
jgi:hypothetical protein